MGGSIFNEGVAMLNNTEFRGGTASGNGGGVYTTNTSTTYFYGVSFSQMTSTKESGGAIYNLGSCYLNRGYFSNNYAYYHGGDIKNGVNGNFTGSNSTFLDST
jgi:hypothetical protein